MDDELRTVSVRCSVTPRVSAGFPGNPCRWRYRRCVVRVRPDVCFPDDRRLPPARDQDDRDARMVDAGRRLPAPHSFDGRDTHLASWTVVRGWRVLRTRHLLLARSPQRSAHATVPRRNRDNGNPNVGNPSHQRRGGRRSTTSIVAQRCAVTDRISVGSGVGGMRRKSQLSAHRGLRVYARDASSRRAGGGPPRAKGSASVHCSTPNTGMSRHRQTPATAGKFANRRDTRSDGAADLGLIEPGGTGCPHLRRRQQTWRDGRSDARRSPAPCSRA